METQKRKQSRVKKIIPILEKSYPNADVTLNFASPFELLIATILAAQCTDERVNIVTKNLFKKYKKPADYVKVASAQLEEDIRSTGFYHNKAKAIKNCCAMLIEDYDGKVPDTMEELTKLPGTGRKTANVVLGNAFGKPAIIVDTHMKRVSQRLGLTQNKNPDKIEFGLREIVPENKWTRFSHLIVFLGRNICTAKNPQHDVCPINKLCPQGSLKLK